VTVSKVALRVSADFGPLGLSFSHLTMLCLLPAYFNTACTSPLSFALPPVGSARTALADVAVTLLTALLKMSCSLPHLGHLTRRKLLRGLGTSLFHSDKVFFSYAMVNFLRRMPSFVTHVAADFTFKRRVCFLVVLANSILQGIFFVHP
jgi:hypothetical protein